MSNAASHDETAGEEGASFGEAEAQHLRLLEALLFAASEPLDEEALAQKLPEEADVRALLDHLSEVYAHRGVNLVRVANGWAFRTAPDLGKQLSVHQTVRRRLSRAALETLAIIAYHQPITRAEIEEVRGVGLSRGTLDLLLEAEWIKPKGRRRAPGRPVTWVTTSEFLNHFGLDSLQDLPGVDELRAAGLLQSDVNQFPGAQDLLAQAQESEIEVREPSSDMEEDDMEEDEEEYEAEGGDDIVATRSDESGTEEPRPHKMASGQDLSGFSDED